MPWPTASAASIVRSRSAVAASNRSIMTAPSAVHVCALRWGPARPPTGRRSGSARGRARPCVVEVVAHVERRRVQPGCGRGHRARRRGARRRRARPGPSARSPSGRRRRTSPRRARASASSPPANPGREARRAPPRARGAPRHGGRQLLDLRRRSDHPSPQDGVVGGHQAEDLVEVAKAVVVATAGRERPGPRDQQPQTPPWIGIGNQAQRRLEPVRRRRRRPRRGVRPGLGQHLDRRLVAGRRGELDVVGAGCGGGTALAERRRDRSWAPSCQPARGRGVDGLADDRVAEAKPPRQVGAPNRSPASSSSSAARAASGSRPAACPASPGSKPSPTIAAPRSIRLARSPSRPSSRSIAALTSARDVGALAAGFGGRRDRAGRLPVAGELLDIERVAAAEPQDLGARGLVGELGDQLARLVVGERIELEPVDVR